jgi:hypothetical protein
MKKDEVPQDISSLGKITKEVCYATDSSGKYVQALSSGWDVKVTALDVAWGDIEKRIASAKQKVLNYGIPPDGCRHFSRVYRFLAMAGQKAFKTGSFQSAIRQ